MSGFGNVNTKVRVKTHVTCNMDINSLNLLRKFNENIEDGTKGSLFSCYSYLFIYIFKESMLQYVGCVRIRPNP